MSTSVMDESKMIRTAGPITCRWWWTASSRSSCSSELCGARKGAGALVMGRLWESIGRACLSVCQSGCEALLSKLGFVPQEGKAAVCHGKAWAPKPGLERLELIYPEAGEYWIRVFSPLGLRKPEP